MIFERSRRFGIVLLLALAGSSVAVAVALAATGEESDLASPQIRAAREKERVLRLEAEAARSGEFYLVASLGESRLSLSLSGVELASYRIDRVDLGLPPADGAPTGAEASELFHCRAPELHPPSEIRPGEAAVPPADPEPAKGAEGAKGNEPGSDAKDPSVDRVAIDCGAPLTLSVVSASSRGVLAGLRERLRFPSDPEAACRVRIVLPDEDAARLFASLPSKILFFVSRIPAATPAPAPTAR